MLFGDEIWLIRIEALREGGIGEFMLFPPMEKIRRLAYHEKLSAIPVRWLFCGDFT